MAAGDRPGLEGGADDGGLDDEAFDTEAFELWCARRAEEGVRVDVLTLYELAAAARGIDPEDLPADERRDLSDRALAVIWPGFERVGNRRPSGPVVLADPDPVWSVRYRAWHRALREVLLDEAVRVEHVGSTSVPGLVAKPIVDVLVAVRTLETEAGYAPGCQEIGLELYSRDDEHRFFVNAEPAKIDVHVHVCEVDGAFERDHLLFRDYLRAHDDERDAYADMKRGVARRWSKDRMAYTYAKSDWILDLLERAEAWAAATAWALPEPVA